MTVTERVAVVAGVAVGGAAGASGTKVVTRSDEVDGGGAVVETEVVSRVVVVAVGQVVLGGSAVVEAACKVGCLIVVPGASVVVGFGDARIVSSSGPVRRRTAPPRTSAVPAESGRAICTHNGNGWV